MASTIDFSSLTLNVEEARETSDLVFETIFVKPSSLSEVHDVRTGIQMDKRIPILGKYGLLGKQDPGSCAVNLETAQIPTSEKLWTPKLISFRLQHCQDDVPDLLKFWTKSMKAAGTWEDIDNEMLAFIESRAEDATFESILRLASFGDTDATDVNEGTGSQVLTAGLDEGYFTPIDGLWKQVFTDQAGAAEIYRYTIAENALSTKVLQLALGATVALDSFRSMYDNISAEAFENGGLEFQITRSLHNNWAAFLEDKSLAFTLQVAEQGKVTKGSYRGIPITIRYDWDRGIKAWHDLGATYYLPHRALLTKLTNIPVGTSDEESMNEFRSFYDFKDKVHLIDVAYKMDVKILLETEVAVAY